MKIIEKLTMATKKNPQFYFSAAHTLMDYLMTKMKHFRITLQKEQGERPSIGVLLGVAYTICFTI